MTDQPSKLPNRKVGSAGLAGALSVLVIWILGESGIDISAEVAAALTTVLMFAVGYLVPER